MRQAFVVVFAAPLSSLNQLASTQDHIGRIAEVSSINQMDPVTVTITNYGEQCDTLTASLTLTAATSQSGVVWPKIYWRAGGGTWTATPSSAITCRGPGPTACMIAFLPQRSPIPPGQSTFTVALEFTSWNDSLYSFAGTIAVYDDGYYSTGGFGLGSTNDWLLNCPSCVVEGPTALPPGAGATTRPPTASSGGAKTQSAAAPGSSGSRPASPALTPAAANPPPPANSAPPAASSSAAAVPNRSSAASARLTPVASSAHNPAPWFIAVGGAAIIASAATALFAARRRRRTDSPPS